MEKFVSRIILDYESVTVAKFDTVITVRMRNVKILTHMEGCCQEFLKVIICPEFKSQATQAGAIMKVVSW